MLNYMLLTVVANGHSCVATATAGNAQGRSQDFDIGSYKAERTSIFFSKKADDLFQLSTVIHKTLLY